MADSFKQLLEERINAIMRLFSKNQKKWIASFFIIAIVIMALLKYYQTIISIFFHTPTNSQTQTVTNPVNSSITQVGTINNYPIPSTMQSGLRRLLIPANDPIPDTPDCPISLDEKVVFLGANITRFPLNLKSFSLINIGGDDVLSVEWNSNSDIVINATFRNENNELVATIIKNVFHSYAPNDYTVTSDDHQILILNSKDEIILSFQYLNPRAIKIMGIFYHPNRPTVRIEDGRVFVGASEIDENSVCIKGTGGGYWNDLKAVLVVP